MSTKFPPPPLPLFYPLWRVKMSDMSDTSEMALGVMAHRNKVFWAAMVVLNYQQSKQKINRNKLLKIIAVIILDL